MAQETVAQLGELDEQGRGRARAGALALRITWRQEQYELFKARTTGRRSEPVAVRLLPHFVHISAVERAGMRDLNEGQKIAYEVVADRRTGKSSADNLKPA